MRHMIWVVLLAVGCGESGELTALKESLRVAEENVAKSTQAVETKTDEAVTILKENTASLTAIKTKIESLEASLVKSEPEPGKEVIKSAENPPAKANTQQAPLKVATPGDFSRIALDGTRLKWNIEGNWNPTILETSAHLAKEHGIDTNGMTHQEMADIHAALHDGKPVAMKARPTVTVNRGSSCPGGVCPTNTRQRKGLFGWRR